MPIGLSLGNNFNEPWKLPIVVASNAISVQIQNGAGGAALYVATNATFWAAIEARGTATNASFTADTYNTIFTHTGKGLVATVVGPTASNTGTMTFEFVIDGATNEVPVTVGAGQRAVLGIIAQHDVYTTAGAHSYASGSNDASKIQINDAGALGVPGWPALSMVAPPMLQYNISFSLRIKHSADITATANNERQCGLVHRKAAY